MLYDVNPPGNDLISDETADDCPASSCTFQTKDHDGVCPRLNTKSS